MDVSLLHASCQPSNRVSMSAGSSGARPLRASEARAERRAALLEEGGSPVGRRGRRGGQWRPHVQQLIHIDWVEHFHAAPPSARRRSRSGGSDGNMAPTRAVAGAPQQALPSNAIAPRAAREVSRAPLVARRGPAPWTPPAPPPFPRPRMASASPCPAPPIAWPARVLEIFRLARVSVDNYEPLTQKYDGWARADKKGLSRLRRPLPGEVDGDLSLLVGLHATDEKGLRGILNTGRLLPGIASEGEYVFMKGYLAYEGNQRHNDEEAQRVLNAMRERGAKHACGVIMEVSYVGNAQDLQNCCAGVGLGRKTRLLHVPQRK